VTEFIFQVLCVNGATTLPVTLADLPPQVPGADAVEPEPHPLER
jgi:hypothetical protein